jgi:glycosyltransferase involved in cell wall biosynthesis
MVIGFDGRWYNQSGVGSYSLRLLNALVRQQGRYRLVLFEHPGNPVPVESDVQRVPLYAGRYTPAGQFELSRQLAKHRVDLVHCAFYVPPFLARCPVVVTFYDLIPFRFQLYGPVKQAIVKAGYRAAVHKARGIVVCSHRTATDCEEILGAAPAKIKVAHAGYSPEFNPESDADELQYLQQRYGVRRPYVLLLGSKHWRTKGLGFGLKALGKCKSRQSFQIVWAGAEEALTEDPEAKETGISEITKCGFVTNADLAKLYRNACAFVLPSLYEGFGMPLLEAMSCGCPVVCSDGGSLPEVAGSGAIVVPHDLERMSQAITAFLLDEDIRNEQKRRALARAAEFSWERSAEVVLRLYEQILRLSVGALSRDHENRSMIRTLELYSTSSFGER